MVLFGVESSRTLFEAIGLLSGNPALWTEILISSVLIVIAGAKLSRYGDVLGEKTGLGNAWVGLILLSAVTSLPELVTCIGTVGVVGEPDLAFGNLFGSNCFNLLIVALLDVLQGPGALLAVVQSRHIVPAGFGLLLMGVAVAPIVLGDSAGAPLAAWSWAPSVLVLVIYVLAVRMIFAMESRAAKADAPEAPQYADLSLGAVSLRFAIAALVIIGAGLWLSLLADRLSETPLPGTTIVLGKTFVGSLLLALVTSLPEVVVTVASFRLGALDMALGNLLGSNIFNMAMVPFCHVVYWLRHPGNLYENASHAHGLTAIMAIFMTGLVVIGIGARSKRTVLRMNCEVAAIVVTYLVGQYLLFQFST